MNETRVKAVELVRSIRDAHYELLKDSSPQQKIAFFRGKARELHAHLGRTEELESPVNASAAPAARARR
jgi:hypothetical protein